MPPLLLPTPHFISRPSHTQWHLRGPLCYLHVPPQVPSATFAHPSKRTPQHGRMGAWAHATRAGFAHCCASWSQARQPPPPPPPPPPQTTPAVDSCCAPQTTPAVPRMSLQPRLFCGRARGFARQRAEWWSAPRAGLRRACARLRRAVFPHRSGRLWRYGALRALSFYFLLSHFDDTVLTGVAIRGQNGLLISPRIAVSPLMKALVLGEGVGEAVCIGS